MPEEEEFETEEEEEESEDEDWSSRLKKGETPFFLIYLINFSVEFWLKIKFIDSISTVKYK